MKPIPGKYTTSAQHYDIKELLGLEPTSKLPRKGTPPVLVDGWLIWVEPVRECTRGKVHRALAQCPTCYKVFSAGRIGQHVKVHLESEPTGASEPKATVRTETGE